MKWLLEDHVVKRLEILDAINAYKIGINEVDTYRWLIPQELHSTNIMKQS